MSDQRFEPEEFERLLGLPEGHPERVRAERSSRLPAWKHMLEAFESPPDQLLEARDLAEAEAELERRVGRAVTPAPASARPRPTTSRFSWLQDWTRGPRAALAVASLAVVATAGWWAIGQLGEPPAVRSGAEDVQSFEVKVTTVPGGIRLRWPAVAGARMYGVTFLGSDLHEIARVDSLHEADFTLRADQLPAGLVRGQSVLVVVLAVRPYDEIASKTFRIEAP